MTSEIVQTKEFARVQALMTRLSIEADLPESNVTTDVILTIMDNMLDAATPEELWAAQEAGATASKDFINRPFTLRTEDVTWKKSSIEGPTSFPFYAMCNVTDLASGETVLLNGGGSSFVAVLSKLQEFEWLDGERAFQLVEKQTGSGKTVILMKPVATVPAPGAKRASAKG